MKMRQAFFGSELHPGRQAARARRHGIETETELPESSHDKRRGRRDNSRNQGRHLWAHYSMGKDPIEYLLESDFLGGTEERHLRSLSPPPEWVTIPTGETLIHEGQVGEAFYLLVSGRLRAFVTDVDGSQRIVGEVLPGEGVGEMALLTGDLTVATVRAKHDSNLIRFSRDTYMDLLRSSPDAALHVTRTVIVRRQHL